MQFALTTYPLSSGFRQRFEQTLHAPPEYLDYAELRRLSFPDFVRRLRGLGATSLLLPIEDELSSCLLPLLRSVAAMAGPQLTSIVHPDLRTETVRRSSVGRALAQLVSASALAARDMAYCIRELAALNGAEPIAHTIGRGDSALYINANLWFGMKAGGSIGHVAGVVNALSDAGWRVTLASAATPSMIREKVDVVPLRIPDVFGLPFEKSYYRFHRASVNQLERRQIDARPQFIYQRMSPANYSGVVLSRRWNVPLVLEYNGSEVWVGKNWGDGFRYPGVASAAEEACLRHASLVVTVSEVLVDELIARGVASSRIVWYPNCVDPTIFAPDRFSEAAGRDLRGRLGIPADATVVMFIGTFGQWHGVELFAEAIQEMAERNRTSLQAARVHFVLVGDGVKMPVVRQRLSALASSGLVTLTGLVRQEEAPEYLAIADVVVSPHVPNGDGSRFFGSPTKLFEYMAMGKTIVASDLDQLGVVLRPAVEVGALPVQDPADDERRLAVLFRPGDVAGMIEAIRFAVGNYKWRTVLGMNARAKALSHYTWTHHVGAILGALDGMRTTSGSR